MKSETFLIKDLSREDRYILEKHGQDIFKMLLRRLLVNDITTEISEMEMKKMQRLLAEYFETRAILSH